MRVKLIGGGNHHLHSPARRDFRTVAPGWLGCGEWALSANLGTLDHLGIQCRDLPASAAFYDSMDLGQRQGRI
jgi:hypothetical protein